MVSLMVSLGPKEAPRRTNPANSLSGPHRPATNVHKACVYTCKIRPKKTQKGRLGGARCWGVCIQPTYDWGV